ncbi:MAG: 50S ribosomal protein L25 [Firmicutes bacterium]|nr:50S ribosomal protein L25 [Bacillota bacterium]MDH7495408.1 50S ribosomal protein L25 [Bacillota bacterium]
MKEIVVNARPRERTGKGYARKARVVGEVPAVVYGKGSGSTSISLDEREFYRAVQAGLGAGKLVKLVINGAGNGRVEKTALLKEVQRDFVRGDVIHVDFQEVSLTEAITATIPVVLVGEERRPNDGGVIEHLLWEIQIHALPADMPERVEVDVSGLRIGDSVKVADLRLPKGVRTLSHADESVVTVAAPARGAEEKRPAAETGEAGGAGEAKTAGEAS